MRATTLEAPQRIRRWHSYLIVWRLHRWLGLSLGLVIVALSLTGGLLVMHHELEHWLEHDRHVIAPPAGLERAAIVPVLRALQAEAPAGFRLLRIEPGAAPTESDKVIFVATDRATRWSAFVDPHRGAILWRGLDQALFTPWLLHLHMHFHTGRWGYVVAGLGGLALTLLGVSGIWLTREPWRALLRHPFRWRLGRRVAFADLHQWLGILTSYFTLVLGATGIWFSVLLVPREFSREDVAPLGPPFDVSTLAPLEPVIAAARTRFPGADVVRVGFPLEASGNLQVRLLHRDAPIWRKQSRIDFNPRTGAMLKVRDARDATAGEQLNSILAPLHFGFYGATWVKWLYAVGGFAPSLLAATGTAVWWLRTRRQRRAGEARH